VSALRDLRRLVAPQEAPVTGRVVEAGDAAVTVATAQGVRVYPRPQGAALMPGDPVRTAGRQLLGRLLSQSEGYAEE
jgi:hypothetical protein